MTPNDPQPLDGAAIQFMVLDFLDQILTYSENPGEMGRFVVQQLRELMGARAVLLLQHGPDPLDGTARIVALEPERARSTLRLDPLLRLVARHPDQSAARVFTRTKADPGDAELLTSLGLESLSLTPLRAGARRVGSLATLELLDLQRSDDVLRLLGLLSPVFALIQRSTFQFQAQEATVQAQAEEYEALWQTNLDGILVVGPDDRIRSANAAYLRMSGYALDDIQGRHMSELDADETPPETSERTRQIIREGSSRFTARHRRKDGSVYPVEVSTTFVPGRGLLLGFIRDLTDRVAAENALRASEARHRELVEILGEGISLTDLDETCHMANPEADRIFGVERGGLLGRNLRDFLDEAGWQRVREYTARRRQGESDTYQIEIRRADGAQRLLQVTVTPQRDTQGQIIGSLGVFRDITEELKLQEALRLAHKMESLGHLASGVAHDMNNVLGAILGLSSLQLTLQPEGSPLQRTFQTITQACLRGRNMVKGLLDFARKDMAGPRIVSLGDLIREEVRLLERTLPANIQVQLDLDPGAGVIQGDPDALSLMLMNLCVNAMDAMPDGGRLTLATRALSPQETLLTVADTGTGMSREVQEHALDPFFTTKPQGKGTGLGLSQAYSTVKAHRGSLEILSRPGEGTTLKIRFPAVAASPGAPAPETPASPRAASGHQVLLVDDDDLVQAAVASQIEVLGHKALVAASGEEAMDLIAQGHRPAIVLLDMNMPGWGGTQTLPKLRAALPGVPILLSTGRADQGAINLAQAHPGVAILPKPFRLEELRAAFAQALPPA
ncbi:MAG: PAS domain S-box protein [Acidobacteriota bacterium]|nr:PAS domain S-box protein [Acidobacteriota bacterium]